MVLQDFDYLFDTLDVECKGYIEWIELKEFDQSLFYDGLDIDQLEAAINMVRMNDISHDLSWLYRAFFFYIIIKK